MSPWYMNFCAPFLPNDPVIQFHRLFQMTTLLFYMIAAISVHAYYKYWMKWDDTPQVKSMEEQSKSAQSSQKQSESEQQQKQSKAPPLVHKKQALNRTRGKIVNFQASSNQSCVELKKTERNVQSNKINASMSQTTRKVEIIEYEPEMNAEQIEKYFPIVVGHFILAMGGSIMYTPYAEQSIICVVYFILTGVLLLLNAKQWRSATLLVWSCMVMIIMFLLTTFLLQIGQSNYDSINWNCFANNYVSLYSH